MTDKFSEAVRQQYMDEVTQAGNFVFDSLVNHQPKAKLPEEVFATHFLPFFSGEHVNARNVLAEWVGVAGTPMSEVDVVNPQGETLFTVPALFDTNIIELAKRQAGNSLADVVTGYEMRSAGIPAVANNYLHTALGQKVKEIAPQHSDESSASQRWSSILARYNKTPGGVTQTGQSQSSDPADDVEYD